MRTGTDALLLVARAGMEISWRYAWVSFLMLATIQRRFPLPEATGAIAMAAFLTHLLLKRNWRVYQTMLLHFAGFALFALLIVYRMWYERFPFLRFAWVEDLLGKFSDPLQWFLVVLIVFCLVLIWRGGRTVVKDPNDYFPVCMQFDKGLGLFLLLFIIKFLVQQKAGIHIEDRQSGFMVVVFFIFSLVSIGLSRDRHDVQKSFLSGYHGIGIILSVATVFVLFGSGVTLLFYSYLVHVADSLQHILRNAAEPMVPVFVKVLSFIFVPGKFRSEMAAGTTSSGLSAPSAGGWEVFLFKVIGVGLMGMIGLLAMGVLGYLMKYILQLLVKRKTGGQSQPLSAAWLIKLLDVLLCIPLQVWNAFAHLIQGVDSAAAIYRRFLRWGRRSGLPAVPSETPGEYGGRVMQHFPKLAKEIEMIVDAFNREVYGHITIDRRILAHILSAQRRMRSPRHWPSRMRLWFLQ